MSKADDLADVMGLQSRTITRVKIRKGVKPCGGRWLEVPSPDDSARIERDTRGQLVSVYACKGGVRVNSQRFRRSEIEAIVTTETMTEVTT